MSKKVNVEEFLYSSTSIPELVKKYSAALRKASSVDNMLHATKLEEYRNIITDKKLLASIRRTFNDLYKVIESSEPNLRFYFEGRRKSFVSAEAKINLYLSQNKSLDELRDFLAFRIIAFWDDSPLVIKKCYNLMTKIIDFMIVKGFTPCSSTPAFDTAGFDKSNFPEIIVPEKSLLPKEYHHLVKDYILHPKKSGYQSLHAIFKDPYGRCFEVQIRTFDMHMHAESSSAAGHDSYKSARYSETGLSFDMAKIKMPGYGIFNDDEVFDFIGLEKALKIMQRQKTF